MTIKTNDIISICIDIGFSFMYTKAKGLDTKEIIINGILEYQRQKANFQGTRLKKRIVDDGYIHVMIVCCMNNHQI